MLTKEGSRSRERASERGEATMVLDGAPRKKGRRMLAAQLAVRRSVASHRCMTKCSYQEERHFHFKAILRRNSQSTLASIYRRSDRPMQRYFKRTEMFSRFFIFQWRRHWEDRATSQLTHTHKQVYIYIHVLVYGEDINIKDGCIEASSRQLLINRSCIYSKMGWNTTAASVMSAPLHLHVDFTVSDTQICVWMIN